MNRYESLKLTLEAMQKKDNESMAKKASQSKM
jgi:hypothetical protein